jgi:hypothetical protein
VIQRRVRQSVERFVQALLDEGVGGDRVTDVWRGALALAFRLLAAPRARAGKSAARGLLEELPNGGDVLGPALESRPDLLRSLAADLLGDPRLELPAMDLGWVYEGLIDLQPGIATEPMVRMQRGRLEAVVPASMASSAAAGNVRRVQAIEAGRFFTFVGLARKQSGAYYTPRDLVAFLVTGALEPALRGVRGEAVLDLRVLDPATGSGHFLTEACRRLADALVGPRAAELPEDGAELRRARRRVAERCLHGADRDPLALELSRLALWDLCGDGELPRDFMAGKLVRGDSLLGPTARDLGTCPLSGRPVEGAERLPEAIGASESVDGWRTVARVFSGTVALGSGDDDAYEALLRAALAGQPLQAILGEHATLRAAAAAGAEAVPFEVEFPEVFGRAGGFDAVVGNPPWEALRPRAKEFYAGLDLRVLDAPTRLERRDVQRRQDERREVAAQRQDYAEALARQRRVHRRLFRWQRTRVGNRNTGGDPDLWKLFMERCAYLVREGGEVGLLVPSAFHTNASAAGVRQLYLRRMALRVCYSFDNRSGLFDIHRSFKFDAILARRDRSGTREFRCAFHLLDLAWLRHRSPTLRYTPEFLRRAGGDHCVFPELRSERDQQAAEVCYEGTPSLGRVCDEREIRLSSALHMTHDAGRFTPAADEIPGGGDAREPRRAAALLQRGYLVLHEGKTFQQFDDRWSAPPRYLVHLERIADRPRWVSGARHFRLAFRAVASSTNERTCIFCVLPPGNLCGNSAPVEAHPWRRPTSEALELAALANSHTVDFLVRIRSSANVNLFILRHTALPALEHPALRALAVHSALRLTCNHEGYAALWREQLGDAWAEAGPRGSWPAVARPEARWRLRAAVDAVVAHAFGLSRELYEHVLGTFSHRSTPGAPQQCLEAFDELLACGEDEFAARNDPYAGVPVVSSLPSPGSEP